MAAALRSITGERRGRLILTFLVIAVGLSIAGFFGARSVRSFREIQYIRQQGLDRGTASVQAVRPWMTIRFIAVAYAVPEEYLYSALGIPFDRRNANKPLGELNKDFQLGNMPATNELVIVEKARAAIAEYRANPVVTGLRDVRPWMSVRYIANSTGVPIEYLFTQLGVAQTGNEDKPLDLLSEQEHYKGGPRAITEAVQQALSAHEGQQ
jgi:hypothetical protein